MYYLPSYRGASIIISSLDLGIGVGDIDRLDVFEKASSSGAEMKKGGIDFSITQAMFWSINLVVQDF